MVVTIKTNTRRDAAWVEFECIKYGIEAVYMQDNVVQITSPSLDKVHLFKEVDTVVSEAFGIAVNAMDV